MQRQVKRRLIKLIIIFSSCLVGAYLIISNLNENIIFFYPPSEIGKIQNKQSKIRIGGLVEKDSIDYINDHKIIFNITDHKSTIKVEYDGLLPALFRENQGIVAEGRLIDDKLFQAEKLLTKHDENYRPPSE